MPRTRYLFALICMLLAGGGLTRAEELPAPRFDPFTFFAPGDGRTWVAEASLFTNDYRDTAHVVLAEDGRSLVIDRVLTRMKDTVVVSRARGVIRLKTENASYAITWNERGYKEATGQMRWDEAEGQWVVRFDGEWRNWAINLRRIDGDSFVAGIARSIGNFPPVELADLTYHAVTPSPAASRKP